MTRSRYRIAPFSHSGLSTSFMWPLAALRQLVLHRAASRSLRHLDDHTLRDIGLKRSDINTAMRQIGCD